MSEDGSLPTAPLQRFPATHERWPTDRRIFVLPEPAPPAPRAMAPPPAPATRTRRPAGDARCRVLALLANGEWLEKLAIADRSGCTMHIVNKVLSVLLRSGTVERRPSATSHWKRAYHLVDASHVTHTTDMRQDVVHGG